MASSKNIIKDAALLLLLKYDNKKGIAYGVHSGYTMLIVGVNNAGRPGICISLCASLNGEATGNLLNTASIPQGVNIQVNNYRINIVFPISGGVDRNSGIIVESVKAVCRVLVANQCRNCDERGVIDSTSVYKVKGVYVLLSEISAEPLFSNLSYSAAGEKSKEENYLMGTIGAIAGAFLVALIILFFARMGKIIAIIGVGLGFATVYGYEKLGKKFSGISMVICSVVAVGMTYLTFRTHVAMNLHKAFKEAASIDADFKYCFKHAREWYDTLGKLDAYNHDFILLMLVGILGIIGAIWVEYSHNKEKYEMYKLG
ncbi:MAG: hypothetical protein ACI4D8_02805 [Wujia sp.]